MPINRWDNSQALVGDKVKILKRCGDMDETTMDCDSIPKPLPSATLNKRKKEDKKQAEEAKSKRLEWLKERAKFAVIPMEESSILRPEHIFLENGPMVIHICHDCRKYNSTRPATTVEEGMMELPLALCTVCRSHFNRQRNLKFFEYELPSVKKTFNL